MAAIRKGKCHPARQIAYIPLAQCITSVLFSSREAVGNIYAMHAGYNAVAEVNNIIVLYPQAAKSLIANPEGCWDW